MKRILLFPILLIGLCITSQAQFTRYQIKLKNKGGTPHSIANPSTYLSQRAIDRRIKYGIAIDSTDLPVTPAYITQVRNTPNVIILNVSKWQNAIAIQVTNQTAIATINSYPFVESVSGIAARAGDNGRNETRNKFEEEENITPIIFEQRTEQLTADYFNYGTNSFSEIHLHNGEFLHNIGLRGQGMQIGMLDNGYNNYTVLNAFDSINLNNQVLGTWDFVNGEANVINDGSHGMSCFSTIAANIPGQFIGKAPKASFWLYKTEDDNGEYPIEEFNWVCGAERADSSGADIISSSLGYYDFDNAAFNYTYTDMNGNTTIAAKGADMAAKKGLLVFNSVGNEGTKPWKFLITPSDADSIVSVGAVTTTGVVGNFSSYGPSSDGQIKPDMASVGVSAMIQTGSNTIGFSNGTSFACPNMAGLGTCLWQGFPEFNNMKIIQALQQSSNKFTTPDDRVGYGIPDMKLAFSKLLIDFATSTSTIDTCTPKVSWTSKDIGAMKYEIERKLPGQSVYSKVGELNPATGSILSIHSYQFTNTIMNSPAGTVSYRIRQIIDTAAATFTAVYIDTTNVTISGSCFSNFLINNASSNATINNCNVTVNWTSRDLGNMKYEIERKGPNETVFTKIGQAAAHSGTVLSNNSYQFINDLTGLAIGNYSYRIRQIIDTTTATFTAVYIDTTSINSPTTCIIIVPPTPVTETITVRPNPAGNSSTKLIVSTAAAITDMTILIFDNKGSLILQLKDTKGTGEKIIDLPIIKLSNGKYYIKVLSGQQTIGTTEMIRL